MLKLYQKAKFVFIPNEADASPRVLTECLSLDVPCLINKNILGGWKYVNNKTGEFFTDENDIEKTAKLLLRNLDKYSPRQFIIDNYGPMNSGIKLKNFLFDNFKNRLHINKNDVILNVNKNEVNYVTIRSPVINF